MATTSSSTRRSARCLTKAPARVLRPAAIGIALLANLAYMLVLTDVAGYDLRTPAVFGRPAQPILISVVIAASVVPPLLGWGLLELLERFVPRRATVIWLALTALVLVGGLPYNGTGITTSDQLLLALMHLIVGAAVIPAFVITSLRRS
ncbi:DUF6069 family protein [Streptomyces xantholiticus]|uniref:DUF6069 family protein n=1 Tax=Streptomyces xantholiticus TaxID=68285 RepID=UPI0016796847|nr:DUF6069 family protein [Streptomyces xantholiticus]GGW65739.1 hypothetical protein GCM10010381_58590 [Streptomyces xantholiticus]